MPEKTVQHESAKSSIKEVGALSRKPGVGSSITTSPAVDRILQLQQTIGNRAVTRLIQTARCGPVNCVTAPSTDTECCGVLRTLLDEEERSGTAAMVRKYNAISGTVLGRNVWVPLSSQIDCSGLWADLFWILDVAWVAGNTAGISSDILGTVLGRLGQFFSSGLGFAAGGMAYWFARTIGAISGGGWSYIAGSVSEDNLCGAYAGMLLGASGAYEEGIALRLRDVIASHAVAACYRPPAP